MFNFGILGIQVDYWGKGYKARVILDRGRGRIAIMVFYTTRPQIAWEPKRWKHQ